MKIITQLSAALLALGIVSQAGADPVVYLTGSTAFRSTIMTAILNNTGTNNGGVFDTGTVTYVTYGNSVPTSCNFAAVHGNINGSPVYLDCAWSGSEAGIASACNTSLQNQDRNGNSIPLAGSPETWLNVSNVTLNGSRHLHQSACQCDGKQFPRRGFGPGGHVPGDFLDPVCGQHLDSPEGLRRGRHCYVHHHPK